MAMNVHALIIDPQKDFMDDPDSALPVPGANADMDRAAKLVDRIGRRLDDIHVTEDSHYTLDYRHPGSWLSREGKMPVPITQGGELITPDDIANGKWNPIGSDVKPDVLGGATVREFMILGAQERVDHGVPGLEIWPEHCLIGFPGHNNHKGLREALQRWERSEQAIVNFKVKGTNVYAEHYGGLMANVIVPGDPSTGLDESFLEMLATADIVAIMGEEINHCVRSTVEQVADNIGREHVRKLHLITDCMSSVDAIPGVVDFPAMAKAWLEEMRDDRGMTLTTSEEFLA